MDSIILNTQVRLVSSDLNHPKIQNTLQSKLNDMYLHKFIKQYGYILEIVSFTYDRNIFLSRINQDIFVNCVVELLTIIPKIGEIYYGIVKIVYPQGIFVKLLNIFDNLIPSEYLHNLGYVFNNGRFMNSCSDSIVTPIDKDTYINMEIIDMKYDNKTFNCIAKLVWAKDIELIQQ